MAVLRTYDKQCQWIQNLVEVTGPGMRRAAVITAMWQPQIIEALRICACQRASGWLLKREDL